VVDDGSRILAGRYEVGELIGRGGMAEVHIGHDTRLGRTVAIKILRSDLARDPSFQNRFRREAQAAAALNHPAIVAVYDTGEDVFTEPTGVVAHVPFIVMEYVEGHTVRGILRDGHAVPIEEGIEITAGVLSALEYSHHAGIVHRDIKPANVMLTPTGAVKVMDFGIARAVADSAATMTQTQAVIGTAQYLSPEQARGEQVDTRSDLYSTGCLLFELLTGRPPFTGDSPVAVAYQHVREIAPSPSQFASDVPEALDRITAKALAKERDARYSSAAEFRADLEAVLRGGTVSAPAVAVAGAAVAAADATQVMAPPAAVTTTQAMQPASPWGSTGLQPAATSGGIPEDEDGKRPWLMWTLIGIAVLAVAGIVALLIANASKGEEPLTVTVPNVVGMTQEDAEAALKAEDLLMTRTEAASDTVPEGEAISSSPAAGEEVDKESNVEVTFSTGPATTAVPVVKGMTEEQAVAELERVGLVVDPNRVSEDDASQQKGRVTKTDPAEGESVSSGSTVTLYVASGNVVVPELVGKSRAEAEQILNGLTLRANTREVESNEAAPDSVLSQDKPTGSLVPQNTTINLEIAIAPQNPTVPENLVGMTYDQAAAALQQAGLTNIRRIDEQSDRPANEVIRVEPDGGSEVEKTQQIDVHVSRGPNSNNGQPTAPATPKP
jgi:serine/threonine-protein kinase